MRTLNNTEWGGRVMMTVMKIKLHVYGYDDIMVMILMTKMMMFTPILYDSLVPI